jgi:hypothetical protein
MWVLMITVGEQGVQRLRAAAQRGWIQWLRAGPPPGLHRWGEPGGGGLGGVVPLPDPPRSCAGFAANGGRAAVERGAVSPQLPHPALRLH